jgi:hypothetical protein
VPSTTRIGSKFSSKNQLRKFIEKVRQRIVDLEEVFVAISGYVADHSEFKGHLKAIRFSLNSLEWENSPPELIAENMNFFDVNRFVRVMESSSSSSTFTREICLMLGTSQESQTTRRFLRSETGFSFISKFYDIRIKCIKKQQEEMEALNSLTRVQIEHEKLQQQLIEQRSITVQKAVGGLLGSGRVLGDLRASLVSVQAPVLTRSNPIPVQAPVLTRSNPIPVQAHVLTRPNPIPVQAHVDLGSQQPFKRSRSHPSSEVQPPKRPVIGDIRDSLVDPCTGLGDLRTGLGSTPKRSRQ